MEYQKKFINIEKHRFISIQSFVNFFQQISVYDKFTNKTCINPHLKHFYNWKYLYQNSLNNSWKTTYWAQLTLMLTTCLGAAYYISVKYNEPILHNDVVFLLCDQLDNPRMFSMQGDMSFLLIALLWWKSLLLVLSDFLQAMPINARFRSYYTIIIV